jgi:hypothetical protein
MTFSGCVGPPFALMVEGVKTAKVMWGTSDTTAEAVINGVPHVARVEQFERAAYVSVWDGRDYWDVKLTTRDARREMVTAASAIGPQSMGEGWVLQLAAHIFRMGGAPAVA